MIAERLELFGGVIWPDNGGITENLKPISIVIFKNRQEKLSHRMITKIRRKIADSKPPVGLRILSAIVALWNCRPRAKCFSAISLAFELLQNKFENNIALAYEALIGFSATARS